MSKKNLLSESTIRKFMKFANIDSLAENFLQEGAYMEEGEHDAMEEGMHDAMEEGEHDAMEEGMHDAVDEMAHPMEEEEDADLDAMDDMDDVDDVADDMDAEGGEELPPEAVAALERAVEDAVDSLLASLAPYGVQGDVEVEDDAPVELPGDEGPEDLDVIDEEEVVNETLNRVTRRLRAMNESRKTEAKRDELADRIASAIAKRLRK